MMTLLAPIDATPSVGGKMSSKFRSQYRGAVLCIFCLGLAQIAFSQAAADDAGQKLTLLAMGEATTSLGHHASFHVYKASDGTTGRVDFLPLNSLQAAQEQIEAWTKLATAIESREHYDEESGHAFNDRIVAEWKSSSDPGTTLFIIIRRDKFSCYYIVSPSMQVAKQIELLIGASPYKVSSRP